MADNEMQIAWDVPITMNDGITLRADVFRPTDDRRHPVLLSYGPYGKGLSFQEAYKPQWDYLIERYPGLRDLTTNRYQNWEVVDPEVWVPDGYAVVRVDSRGTGRSPGMVDLWSQREAEDLYQCIEWAGNEPWCNGRVGLAGISYYAMNQYQVAALNPPHLKAICPWEGASDWYREFSRHGGILCEFAKDWYPRQVSTVQNGVGRAGDTSSMTGELVAGPETLDQETLARRRTDLVAEMSTPETISDWHTERNPDWTKVTTPMLSAANWGGHGLHTRGNIEAFVRSASKQKWLEVHGDAHWVDFYSERGIELQKRFFDYFLKDTDNGWDSYPPVHLRVRQVDDTFVDRLEHEWPLARTQWTEYHLTVERALTTGLPNDAGQIQYATDGPGITFLSEPLPQQTEITGPLVATIFVSSETTDADIFAIVRLFDPSGDEVTFMGALDPNTPVAQGWIRASHRAVDTEASLPHQPVHRHLEVEPLTPGEIYELEVEIWPTSIVIPAGYQIGLTIKGNDYRYEGELTDFAKTFHYANRGIGPFSHSDPKDRPSSRFGGNVTIHVGGDTGSRLLTPIIPANASR